MKKPYILAIDGRAAAGKSTLAMQIAKNFGASVIHIDDFFLPMELRTRERYEEIGGNVHYERFCEEILTKISTGELESYRRFSCKSMSYEDEPVKLCNQTFYVVEGAYSTHPKFEKYYDASIFVDVDKETQLQRIRQRNGIEAVKMFEEKWIPLEERYFKEYQIQEKCDYTLNCNICKKS